MNNKSEKFAESSSADSMPFLLTIDEVASLLRTSKKSIYNMVYRNQLPGVIRIGFRLLIQRNDLLQWLNERRTLSSGSDGR